ncbi:RNA-binding protein, partial [Phytophthora megakarya]
KELTDEELKSRRTVFVGNVSLDATQKDIKNHFSVCGKVESVRLRHLPIAGCAVDQAGNQKLMMKVCANKKILTTAKDNCNAYVTFVDESSVEAAIKLNGTTLVQKKIRVDHAEPEIDPRRSIFVGNVPFKCTDDQMLQFFMKRLRTDEEPEPVLNVRLIRDRESGLGKGFGYLLLKTPGLVAKTLALSNLKMENRELRVQVCAKRFKNLRGEETTKEKYEGLRASAGARARRMLKRKAGAEDFDRGFATKKMKRTAAAAGLGKKLKPKHAARKAAKAAAEAEAAAKGKKRKHDHSASKKVEKPKAKKPKHAARKAKQAAAKE